MDGMHTMESLIRNFPEHLLTGLEDSKLPLTNPLSPIQQVVVSGMGGSAFGAEVVKNYISGISGIPFLINRDYSLPAFVSNHTLVLISSYSGNTEETFSCLKQACEKGAKIICISSGGKIKEEALRLKLDYLSVPEGLPPRAAAGFSIIRQLQALRFFGIIPDFSKDLSESVSLLKNNPAIPAQAEILAAKLKNKPVVIYTSPDLESSAIRWRQQIQENAKQIAFHHTVPEMNHNELVGWKFPAEILEKFAVIFLRSSHEFDRTRIRMDINKEIISSATSHVFELVATGNSNLSQNLYLVHFGDWVSLYLAKLNEVDPMPVEVVNYLKSELEKFSF